MTSKIRIEDAFSNYTCFYVDEFMWQQKIVSNLKAGDKLSNNKNKTWDDCFHIQMRKRKQENRNGFVIEYWILNMNWLYD